MKFGKLFKAYAKLVNIDLNTLSANRCSKLSYAELRTMAKNLKYYGYVNYDYTHDSHYKLAHTVYNGLVAYYNALEY